MIEAKTGIQTFHQSKLSLQVTIKPCVFVAHNGTFLRFEESVKCQTDQ